MVQNKKPLILAAAAAAVVLLIVVIVLAIAGGNRAAAAEAAVAEGMAYLESQEARDPAIVDRLLRERREAELAAQKEELLRKLYAGELDAWSMFDNYVLLGDSRAVGFYYYGFLDESRVLAGAGDTIRKIEEHMDEIKALNPAQIYLCYGLNDVSIGFWTTPESYAEEMMEIVGKLRQTLPDATVIISSILPATDPAFERASKWREIPQYSDAVEAACKGVPGVIFVDNDQTAYDHMDEYAPDGIHLNPAFYNYWGSNLIAAALSSGTEEAEEQP